MTGFEDGLDMRVKGKASIKEYSQFSRKNFIYSKWDDWGGRRFYVEIHKGNE